MIATTRYATIRQIVFGQANSLGIAEDTPFDIAFERIQKFIAANPQHEESHIDKLAKEAEYWRETPSPADAWDETHNKYRIYDA